MSRRWTTDWTLTGTDPEPEFRISDCSYQRFISVLLAVRILKMAYGRHGIHGTGV
jgi:hypothetical protein